MKLMIVLSLLTNFAWAQSNLTLESDDGILIRKDGSYVVDGKKFDTFDLSANPSSFKKSGKVFKDDYTQHYYIKKDKNHRAEKFTSVFKSGSGIMSNTWGFENNKVVSHTECHDSSCTTVTRNLCNSLTKKFGDLTGDGSLDKLSKKNEECSKHFQDIYDTVIAPNKKDIAQKEDDNLIFTSAVLSDTSLKNFFKSMSMVVKEDNKLNTLASKKSIQGMQASMDMSQMLWDLSMACQGLMDPPASKVVIKDKAPVPKKATQH